MADHKYYVVFKGHNPGVYNNWEETKLQTDGYPGAVFKGYSSSESAAEAFRKYSGIEDRNELFRLIAKTSPANNKTSSGQDKRQTSKEDNYEVDWDSWAVDASCLGNPGQMEYRGVDLKTGKIIFQMGPFEDATNNVGEYLAIVHAIALMAKKGEYHNIYSDSRIAMGWFKKKRHNSKLQKTDRNKYIFELLERADKWVQSHNFPGVVRKWDTERWGEIPADYGRK